MDNHETASGGRGRVGHPPLSMFRLPQRNPSQILWDRWWLVLLGVLLGLGVALFFILRATPVYQSTARLYVESSGSKLVTDLDGVVGRPPTYLATQCEILRSTPVLRAALQRPEIKDLPWVSGDDDPIACLKKKLMVQYSAIDDLISVSAETLDAGQSALLVNAVVDAYVAYTSQHQHNTAAEALRILEREKEKREAEQGRLLQAILEFKKANGALSFQADGSNVCTQRLARLSEALTAAQLDAISAKADYEAAKAVLEARGSLEQPVEVQAGRAGIVVTGGEAAQRRADLDRLRCQLVTLQQECTDDHPLVVSLKAQIAALQQQTAERTKGFTEACLAEAQQRFLTAQARVGETRAAFESQQQLATQLNLKAAEYAKLTADLKHTEQLNQVLDSRIKETNVAEDSGALRITVLEPAVPAAEPNTPMKPYVFAVAIFLGLLVGAGGAYIKEWREQRLHSCDEISRTLGLPVLGVVPSMDRKGRIPAAQSLSVLRAPQSRAAEAYRGVRTAVYFGVPKGRAKTILVTSPQAGDGKSTLASNLAIAMAQTGHRTLLLDADFRRPAQPAIFEMTAEAGLASLIVGEGTAEELIRPTVVPHLDILPCGPIPPNPAELLNSQVFIDLLKELSQRYDHIIIDSPPVNAVTDASILGGMADVTLLVLRAEKSSRHASEQALDTLYGVGAHVLGIVVNAVPRRKDPYYAGRAGYHRYGCGYGYGQASAGTSTQTFAEKAREAVSVN